MIHMFCKDLMPDALRDSTLSIYLGLEFALGVHWLGNQKAYGLWYQKSCLLSKNSTLFIFRKITCLVTRTNTGSRCSGTLPWKHKVASSEPSIQFNVISISSHQLYPCLFMLGTKIMQSGSDTSWHTCKTNTTRITRDSLRRPWVPYDEYCDNSNTTCFFFLSFNHVRLTPVMHCTSTWSVNYRSL